MKKTRFNALNRKFVEFFSAAFEKSGVSFTTLRTDCHFDNNALSRLKKG